MKPNSVLAMVGNMIEVPAFAPANLVFHRITLAGSLIGGVALTDEVLKLCAEHDIRPEIEMIDMENINTAWKRMENEDVRFRHVIDMASLKRRTGELEGSATQFSVLTAATSSAARRPSLTYQVPETFHEFDIRNHQPGNGQKIKTCDLRHRR